MLTCICVVDHIHSFPLFVKIYSIKTCVLMQTGLLCWLKALAWTQGCSTTYTDCFWGLYFPSAWVFRPFLLTGKHQQQLLRYRDGLMLNLDDAICHSDTGCWETTSVDSYTCPPAPPPVSLYVFIHTRLRWQEGGRGKTVEAVHFQANHHGSIRIWKGRKRIPVHTHETSNWSQLALYEICNLINGLLNAAAAAAAEHRALAHDTAAVRSVLDRKWLIGVGNPCQLQRNYGKKKMQDIYPMCLLQAE